MFEFQSRHSLRAGERAFTALLVRVTHLDLAVYTVRLTLRGAVTALALSLLGCDFLKQQRPHLRRSPDQRFFLWLLCSGSFVTSCGKPPRSSRDAASLCLFSTAPSHIINSTISNLSVSFLFFFLNRHCLFVCLYLVPTG